MKDLTVISFPGFGIEEFELNKVAFSIGNVSVRWYGILITIGILFAFLIAYLNSKRDKLVPDDLLDIGLFTVISGIVGARLYYVITSATSGRDTYSSFLDVIAVWNGGLAIYGGIIGGMLAIYGVCKYKKINWMKLMDMIAPGVMVAQAIGRWGNFFNGEAHGGIVTVDSPLYIFRMGLYEKGTFSYFHPTFLYESVWNLLGFILIQSTIGKKKFDGQIALEYIAWYGFGRMFIEGLRTDSLYIGHTDIRISQVVGLLCFFVAGGLLIAGLICAKRGKIGVMEGAYYPGAKRLAILAAEAQAKSEAEQTNETPHPETTEETAVEADPSEESKESVPDGSGQTTDEQDTENNQP